MNNERNVTATPHETGTDGRGPRHNLELLIARHSNTPASALAELAGNPNTDVVAAVARHPNTTPDVLAQLSAHTEPEIRGQVARRGDEIEESVLVDMASEETDVQVLTRLVWHPRIPSEALLRVLQRIPDLSFDPSENDAALVNA